MLDCLRSNKTGPWIVFGGIAVLAIFLLIVGIAFSKVYEAVYHEYAASEHEAARKKKFEERCSGIVSAESLRRCFNDEIRSGWETQRAQEDLKAQKEMARWAFWMVVLTGAIGIPSLAITAGGIWLVYLNLREARLVTAAAFESNQLTKALAASERRPWLGVTVKSIHVLNRDEHGKWVLDIELEAANSGSQPALDVVVGELINIPIGVSEARLTQLETGMRDARPYEGQIIFPKSAWPLRSSIYFDPGHNEATVFNGVFGGWVQYRFEGDPALHFTPFVYQVSWSTQMRPDDPHFESQPHGIAPT